MPYRLSTISRNNLRGVHPDLVRVVERAIQITPVDFRVLEGLRSKAQQRKNIEKGVSWTMNSRHLTGHAVDLVPMIGKEISWSWPLFYPLADAVKKAAAELHIPIKWGGDWKKNKDGPHFELDRKFYPA